MEQAAAALLRVTLIAAGCNPYSIELRSGLFEENNATLQLNKMTVEVKMAPKLNVRLSPNSASKSVCANAYSWDFYQNATKLQECGFIPSRFEPRHGKVELYIINEWVRELSEKHLSEQLSVFLDVRLSYIERLRLKFMINNYNRSFLYIDSFQWNRIFPNTEIMQIPLCAAAEAHCLSSLNKTVTLRIDGDLMPILSKTFALFSPTYNDLIEIIHLIDKNELLSASEAACKWALQSSKKIDTWRQAAIKERNFGQKWVAVIICERASEQGEYYDLQEILYNSGSFPLSIQIQMFDICNDEWLFRMLIHWISKNVVFSLVGVVLSNDMATAAASVAKIMEIPLITYDVGIDRSSSEESVVFSATGRMTHLTLGLHRLFTQCRWRRLAVVSDSTPLAAALTDAFRIRFSDLVIYEVNIITDMLSVLRNLLKMKARVILVNSGATIAANVLAAAHKLNMTRDAGFVWIVREYHAADNATAVIKPLTLSFSWRGNVTNEKKNVISTINSQKVHQLMHEFMNQKWLGRAFPLHAMPLVDALLTFAGGLYQLSPEEAMWFYSHQNGTLRFFWSRVQQSNIPGFFDKLTYDNLGVAAPRIFVEEWAVEPRPRILATWRSNVSTSTVTDECPLGRHPPSDGSEHCYFPEGNKFSPICHDTEWFVSGSAITFLVFALLIAVVWGSRRVLAVREQRIKTKFAKRILARRERVFAALADHLVDRADLELQQELGKGRFGCVRLGVLRVRARERRTVTVAAKALREDAASAEESEFLKEACTLAELEHEHIIRFIGVCLVDGPPLLLMEHAFFGELLQYLQARRYLAEEVGTAESELNNAIGLEEKVHVSAEALTRLAQEAAAALVYLAQRKIVHRDVRASNCLVDKRRSLKLADFGLARATGTVDGEYACRRRGLFPVLWMAPESLTSGVSSAASDVWAFGVLVFELVTLGRRPYGAMPPPSVLQHVIGGGRPQLPWDASVETRALLHACWRRVPEERPQVERLQHWLQKRRRALRPALARELVDIDSEIYGDKDLKEFDI